MSGARVETVFCDLGGTLLRVDPSVGEVYVNVARRHGVEASPADVERQFSKAWRRSLERARARDYRSSDDLLRAEWRTIVAESFGAALSVDRFDDVFDDLYNEFATGRAWVLAPGARETLEHLRNTGVRLAVLSNWDSRCLATVQELGIADYFDAFVISHRVGFEKPHAAIFEAALAACRTAPTAALHIGDSLEADIVPARRLGLRTLWVASRDVRERGEAAIGGGGVSVYGIDSFGELCEASWRRLLC